jgi:hypothetical protein
MAGDPLARLSRALGELGREMQPLVAAVSARPGAPLHARLRALAGIGLRIGLVAVDTSARRDDPLRRAARRLPSAEAGGLDERARAEVAAAVAGALERSGKAGRD